MLKTIRTEVLGKILAIAVGAALSTGCAKIGEPQPPEVRVPRAAVDLAAHQLADSIILKVTRPSQNTDGSSVTTLASIDVFRLNEDGDQSTLSPSVLEGQFAERAERILSIPISRLADYLQGESVVIQDKINPLDQTVRYSNTYRYAVLFINRKNQAAGFSNQAVITPVPIPFAPTRLSATVLETSIRLKWTEPSANADGSKPPRIAGYKIYRAEGAGELQPVHSAVAVGSSYEDRGFQFDKLYRYVIRTVGSVEPLYAESGPSEILPVETRDIFPPVPPENFHAIRREGSIILLWAPSSSADVAGYRIYRQGKDSGTRVLLQKDLITAFNYRDSQPEGDFTYAIQAVDTHGNESALLQAEVEAQ